MKAKKARRLLFSIGGAGAEGQIAVEIINRYASDIREGKIKMFINCGDHQNIFQLMLNTLKLNNISHTIINEWNEVEKINTELFKHIEPSAVSLFYNSNIFAAIYTINLLMRHSDILICKPSEFSFYPIPKLLVKRVGGHEAWGAIHSSEIGDGTIECETLPHTFQALELLTNEEFMLEMFCENIIKHNKIGTYNGAYNAIKLATQKK